MSAPVSALHAPDAPDAPQALVVDDDPFIRAVLADVLEGEGFATRGAANGREALARLADRLPRVIFLDMRMPVMDGWAFAAECRRRYDQQVPIIVMTAAQDAQRWCREVEAEGCLPKPFDLDEFTRTLDHVVRHAA